MPKKSVDEEYQISETGNWNVAARYSEEKIMKPLINCDIYSDIARFGYESFMEELVNYFNVPSSYIRITALNRLINELTKIINNSKFAMKKPGTLESLNKIESQLLKIESTIQCLYNESYNELNKTKTMIIDEVKFKKVLNILINLKSDINDPLNKNHLIFTDKEEFDPVAFKEKLKTRMINKG